MDKLNRIMLYRVHLVSVGFELATFMVKGTDCIGSCKSNYHTIMAMMAPHQNEKKENLLLIVNNVVHVVLK
jgi:hypothetical protein